MFGLETIEVLMLVLAAVVVGFSKAGIQGATIPAVAMLALIFGGKESAGIMLPMLIVGDLVAIFKYGKQGNIRDVVKLMPSVIVGIVLGSMIGNRMNDQQFKIILGIIVLICLLLLVVRHFQKQVVELPDNRLLHWLVGVVSGFSSMVGNASGPIFNVYILAQNLKKESMIGTTAWFFFLMNLLKVPFHIFSWGTITMDTMKYTLFSVPFIGIGALIGIWIIRHISETTYKYVIMVMTAITAIRLLL